jgi:putative flippase GtrA
MTLAKKYLKLVDIRTFSFFLGVGATSALFYFLSFGMFYNLLHWHYKVAVSFAYFISILVHFLGNRTLTFKSHGAHLKRHISRYIVMVLINYCLTLLVMCIVVQILRLNPYIGIVASIGATTGVGYLIARFWVFARVHPAKC